MKRFNFFKNSKAFQIVFLLLIFTVAPSIYESLMAQGAPPPPAPTGVPIDGGLSALVAGMAIYGVRKIQKNRENIE